MDDHLYRIGPNFSIPAGPESVLTSNHDHSNQILLNTGVNSLLEECRSFKTIPNHLHKMCASLPMLKKRRYLKGIAEQYANRFKEIYVGRKMFERMLKEIFTELTEKEFLISQDTFSKWASSTTNNKNSTATISSVGIVTRDRVESLEASLASYIENSQRWNRTTDFLVFDDSPERETRQIYREKLKALKEKYKAPLFYAGFEEKRAYADHLIRAGLPAPVVNFALFDVENFGQTFGVNRNALLLHTVGEMVFSADDDTMGHVAKSPTIKEGLQLGCGGNLYHLWFYSNRSAALNSVSFA